MQPGANYNASAHMVGEQQVPLLLLLLGLSLPFRDGAGKEERRGAGQIITKGLDPEPGISSYSQVLTFSGCNLPSFLQFTYFRKGLSRQFSFNTTHTLKCRCY